MGSNLLPFRHGTRQRHAKVGTIAYAANSTGSIELPRVGLLARVIVQFRGTVTLSGAGALADLGPWSLVSRFRLNTNIGAAQIVDVSGYGAYMAQRLMRLGQSSEKAGMGDTTADTDLYAAPVANGANTWALSFELPVNINDGVNFETGLINLQAPETRVTLDIQTGALTDGATLVTGISGTFHVYYEYYEIPDPRMFMLPPLAIARLLEEQQAVGQTGDNIYTVPRQGTLLALMHRLTLNGARSDSYDETRIKFNKTDEVYRDDRQWLKYMNRNVFGLNPVTGVICRDFFHANSGVNMGDTRDAIDSEELTTLESIVTVSAGATLGASNNVLASVRRIVQLLQG